MRPNGRVNLVGLLMILAVVGGIWAVVIFSPAYLDNLDLVDAVEGSFNEYNRTTQEKIIRRILETAGRVGTHRADDGYGNMVERKGLGLRRENINIHYDYQSKSVRIRVEYDRPVHLKPFARYRNLHFVVEKEGVPPP